MLIKRPDDVRPSEITSPDLYLRRREFMLGAAGTAAVAGLVGTGDAQAVMRPEKGAGEPLEGIVESQFSTDEKPTTYKDVTTYNNFYEFGTDKRDPAKRCRRTSSRSPGRVTVDGRVRASPATIALEDILKPHQLEERIYRLRCVEAWSMVVPWVGFPLADVLKRFEPTSKAKYVGFRDRLFDPEQMPGQKPRVPGLALRRGAAHRRGHASRSRCWRSGCTARCCRTRTARRCAWWCPGSTASRASSPSCRIRFTENEPPTSWNVTAPRRVRLLRQRESRRWTTRAGARRASAASASSSSVRHAALQRLRASRWRASTRAWTSRKLLLRRTRRRPR